MSKFTIYSASGEALYTGTPTYTGSYRKPGMLEFREVSLPEYIDFAPGCYVDYTRVQDTAEVSGVPTEIPHRFKIYTVPQVKKQARNYTYGGAFVYQSVQLFDASKDLEICPFRDLVKGDNRIHFSTQPSISTFEPVDGLAARFQACLEDLYGDGSWVVRVATLDDGASDEIVDLMAEAREFTVSGVNLLEALDKVFDIWPDVGWVYRIETPENSDEPRNTIIIGGGGLNPNEGVYAYGKGFGLKSITRTVANADELATRVFAYGSSRNMLPRWYNNQSIKDAESVDIQNLMIPVSEWGLTGGVPDAAKAYIEAPSSVINRLGVRPKTYYFDGTGDLPEIYPTIREMTIKNVRDSKSSSSDPYYPKTTIYTNGSVRVDQVMSVDTVFDSGLAGDESGKSGLESDSLPINVSNTFTQLAGLTYYPFYHYQGEWTPTTSGTLDLSSALNLGGVVTLDGIDSVIVSVRVKHPSYQGSYILSQEYELTRDGANSVSLSGIDMGAEKVRVDAVTYQVFIDVSVKNIAQAEDKTGTYTITGGIGFTIRNYRAKTFKIGIRQIGFDINAQSALGESKTIAFRSGKCAGRSFAIKNCSYVSATDSWNLEVIRSEDESLSQWFPNADYPVRGKEQDYDGDEFVLLDIAMPDEYVLVAERKLFASAQELLDDASVERWQYNPDVDAKFMVENEREIRPGETMTIMDGQVVESDDDTYVSHLKENGGGYFLTSKSQKILLANGGYAISAIVDTVVIAEGEANIPTYKVTLLDRKRKSFTESKGAESISSNPVTKVSNATAASSQSTMSDSFFMVDADGNITLKEQYLNLYVRGWLAAGGVGDDSGGGGGGGASVLDDLEDVSLSSPSNGQALIYRNGVWVNETIQVSGNYIPLSGSTAITGTLGASGWSITTGGVGEFATIRRKGSLLRIGNSNNQGYVWLQEDTYLANAMLMGGTSTSSSNAIWTIEPDGDATFASVAVNGGTSSGFLKANGSVDTTTYLSEGGAYIGTTPVRALSQAQDLTGISSIKLSDPESMIKWENNAWHFYGNVYADGWIASGGIGSDSGGGGGISSVSLVEGTANGTLRLSVNGVSGSNVSVHGLGSLAYKSSLSASDIPDIAGSYVTLATEQNNISGAKTFTAQMTAANIIPGGTNNLGLSASRWNKVWAVDQDLSGNLSLASSSYIDIGPVRIKFENNALHITKVDPNDNNNYGLYADGFVAAGGIGQTS